MRINGNPQCKVTVCGMLVYYIYMEIKLEWIKGFPFAIQFACGASALHSEWATQMTIRSALMTSSLWILNFVDGNQPLSGTYVINFYHVWMASAIKNDPRPNLLCLYEIVYIGTRTIFDVPAGRTTSTFVLWIRGTERGRWWRVETMYTKKFRLHRISDVCSSVLI